MIFLVYNLISILLHDFFQVSIEFLTMLGVVKSPFEDGSGNNGGTEQNQERPKMKCATIIGFTLPMSGRGGTLDYFHIGYTHCNINIVWVEHSKISNMGPFCYHSRDSCKLPFLLGKVMIAPKFWSLSSEFILILFNYKSLSFQKELFNHI